MITLSKVMELFRYTGTWLQCITVLSLGLITNEVIQYGNINDSVVLQCKTEHWSKRIWEKDATILAHGNMTNNEVKNRLKVLEHDLYYNLYIHSVIDSDAGHYQCVIQDKNGKVHTQNITLLLSFESTTHDIERLKLTTEDQSSTQNCSLKPEDNCKTFPCIWVYCASIVAISILIGLSIWVICKDKNRGLVHIENTPQSTLHDNTVYDHDWRDAKN